MEANDNKQLALGKAVSAHEQAAAGLADLMTGESDERYEKMLSRIKQNLAELRGDTANSKPGDLV